MFSITVSISAAAITIWTVSILPKFYLLLVRCRRIYHDFAARRFYNPFRIPNVMFVRGKQEVTELSETPCLSQAAVYSDIFNFEASIGTIDSHETLGTRARLYGRVIGKIAPSRLSVLQPIIEERLAQTLSRQVGHSRQGTSVLLAPFLQEFTARAMCLIMFGPVLEQDSGFLDSLRQYTTDTVNTMKALTIAPRILAPLVRRMVGKNDRERNRLVSKLKHLLADPINEWQETKCFKQASILGQMMDVARSTSYWTDDRLAHALVGIWFASSHQPWTQTFFLIYELTRQPQYIPLLRQELERSRQANQHLDLTLPYSLPLLDAFIKESIRTDPADTWSVRRKALEPHTFKANGMSVPQGTIVAVNVAEISTDAALYTRPHEFCPERWLPQNTPDGKQSLLTDVSPEWLLWGFGSRQCPGRFLATYVIKTTLVWVLENYDIEPSTPINKSHFAWETFKLPVAAARIILHPR